MWRGFPSRLLVLVLVLVGTASAQVDDADQSTAFPGAAEREGSGLFAPPASEGSRPESDPVAADDGADDGPADLTMTPRDGPLQTSAERCRTRPALCRYPDVSLLVARVERVTIPDAIRRAPEELQGAIDAANCLMNEIEAENRFNVVLFCRGEANRLVREVELILTYPADLIVLLQSSDGSVGRVSVNTELGSVLLDAAYASADVDGRRPPSFGAVSEEEVGSRFALALSAQPVRPESYTIYFIEGTTTPQEGYQSVLEQALADISARPTTDVTVIGHADTVGSTQLNDQLSERRADEIADFLVDLGVDRAGIITAGRGERELIIQTEDEVSEELNRRVEITVR